jgi:hypothetical protein
MPSKGLAVEGIWAVEGLAIVRCYGLNSMRETPVFI